MELLYVKGFDMAINGDVLAIDHEGGGAGEVETESRYFLRLGEAGEGLLADQFGCNDL